MKITELDLQDIRRLRAFLAEIAHRIEAGGNDEVEVLCVNEYRSMQSCAAFHPHSQYRLIRIDKYDDYKTAAVYAVDAALRSTDEGKLLRSVKTLISAADKAQEKQS